MHLRDEPHTHTHDAPLNACVRRTLTPSIARKRQHRTIKVHELSSQNTHTYSSHIHPHVFLHEYFIAFARTMHTAKALHVCVHVIQFQRIRSAPFIASMHLIDTMHRSSRQSSMVFLFEFPLVFFRRIESVRLVNADMVFIFIHQRYVCALVVCGVFFDFIAGRMDGLV